MRKVMKGLLLVIGATMTVSCAISPPVTSQVETLSAAPSVVIRLWELEVDPKRLDAFKTIGNENQQTSMRLEPGVLMMHTVQLADAPSHVRLLEVYASQSAYEAHIRTPHFLKFKTASEQMVRTQRLVPINPITLCGKGGTIALADARGLMVRIAVISVNPAQLDAYKASLSKEQEASVRLEPGVLMLHSVQYAEDPTQVRLLEVYASREAYQSHIKSPQFLEYKTGTEKMVTALQLPLANPILLSAKARREGSSTCL